MSDVIGDAQDDNGAASVKVVVTGAYGVGKSTLIRSLSEITVLTTERRVGGEGNTDPVTIAMDFGRMTVPPDATLYLFGTPAHRRFDFMWEILAEGMLGFMLLVDHDRPDSTEETSEILNYISNETDVPFIVVVNRVQEGLEERAVKLTRHKLRLDESVHVVAADVRDTVQAKRALVELLIAAQEHAVRTEAAAV